MTAMETGAFGADVTMLLHQKKLGQHADRCGVSPSPRHACVARDEHRGAEAAARAHTRYYKTLCLHGMDAGAAITAIGQGKLTVETLAGAALAKKMSALELRNAVIRA